MKTKKILSAFLLTLILTSCSHNAVVPSKDGPATTGDKPAIVVATPTPAIAVDPAQPKKIITLKCDSTCTAAERAELPAIEAAMNKTLASQCLMDYFMQPGKRLDNTNNLSPLQIVEQLRIPTALTLNYYYSKWTAALGYESADDFTVIHFNRAKLGGWSACEKASLGAHEFSHTKKFFHNGNKAAPNYYTIPYQVNHAFEPKSDDAYNGGCCVN